MTDRADGRRGNNAEVLRYHGATTGRWPGKGGRITHTVYPVKHMVAVGDLIKGFEFYGPFDTPERARAWASANINLRSASAYHVYPMFDVRNDA